MTLRDQLRAVYDQHGELTPALVVDAARPKSSPLHNHVFDRTQEEAAESWYLTRAADLIRSVKVVYRDDPEARNRLVGRAFVAVPKPSGTVYEPVEKLRDSDDEFTRRLVLQTAEREWVVLRRKYENLAEFLGMVEADLRERQAA